MFNDPSPELMNEYERQAKNIKENYVPRIHYEKLERALMEIRERNGRQQGGTSQEAHEAAKRKLRGIQNGN